MDYCKTETSRQAKEDTETSSQKNSEQYALEIENAQQRKCINGQQQESLFVNVPVG